MGQKEYAPSHKAHTCQGGLDCCGTKYGPRKSKHLTRRHLRRVLRNLWRKMVVDERIT